MKAIDYIIRPIKDDDIPEVIEIDHESFGSDCLFPAYTTYGQSLYGSLSRYIVASLEKDIEPKTNDQDRQKVSWLKRPFMHSPFSAREKHRANTGHIIGFAGLWVMLSEAHISAIAVRNDYRQRGIGEALLISIIDIATQLNTSVITLEVRASNSIAQRLYNIYGFHVVGRHPHYYSDNREDALLMSTDTISSARFEVRFQRLKQAHRQRQQNILLMSS